VFETLRLAIVDGTVAGGQRLPATRELAEQLQMSRNTVITAYEMLLAEGYVEARQGAGYFVASDLPERALEVPEQTGLDEREALASLSTRGAVLAAPTRPVPKTENPAFQPGLPDLSVFPFEQWYRCVQQVMRRPDFSLLKYHDQGGYGPLKTALRDYLQNSRGVQCTAEQIIIVNGSQAALDLVARLLVNEGDHIAVEEPGYLGARDGFRAAGAQLLPVPVDDDGLDVDALSELSGPQLSRGKKAPIKLVYTTPSYQFPLGKTLSLPRRLALLQWAAEANGFILEDDYDSEFRFGERPLSSLQGLDRQGRVIYMGTFSKVMFPGLRLGYIVVPPGLSKAFASALRKTGQDNPLMLQAAMAVFIREGYFASHLRKMRKRYAEKQQRLVEVGRRLLGDYLHVSPSGAGMQVTWEFRRAMDEQKLLALAAKEGLIVACLSYYYLNKPTRRGLFLGYTGVAIDDLEANVKTLAKIVKRAGARTQS